MTMTANRISQIQLVMIPSTDQTRSVAFYEALGFEVRNDIPWGDGHRWVELYPPAGTAGIALVPPEPDEAAEPGSMGVDTGIILNTDDIETTHGVLRSGGVDVDAQVARPGAPEEIRIGAVRIAGPTPPMFWFRDPDRNRLLVVEVN
jgi:catechol 2,3-dioxygenase-like lactoylglutathione lyase family enzyme